MVLFWKLSSFLFHGSVPFSNDQFAVISFVCLIGMYFSYISIGLKVLNSQDNDYTALLLQGSN